MIYSILGKQGEGMTYKIQSIEFSIYDCTFIERDLYHWLCYMFQKYEGHRFGYKINKHGSKIYFIKDNFLQELEEDGWL